jgi:hypothetical protein
MCISCMFHIRIWFIHILDCITQRNFRILLYSFLTVEFEETQTFAGHGSRTVFACADAVIVGSNPTSGVDVWCVYEFILCCIVLYLGKGLATAWCSNVGARGKETERDILRCIVYTGNMLKEKLKIIRLRSIFFFNSQKWYYCVIQI